MLIAIFEGTSKISKLIGWFTRSKATHCGFWDDKTHIFYEAKEGIGVREFKGAIPGAKGIRVRIYKFKEELNLDEYTKLVEFLKDQRGKDYDYRSVFRAITRKPADPDDVDKWFCSELVAFGSDLVGRRLQNKEYWRTYPDDIMSSPTILLKEIITL